MVFKTLFRGDESPYMDPCVLTRFPPHRSTARTGSSRDNHHFVQQSIQSRRAVQPEDKT